MGVLPYIRAAKGEWVRLLRSGVQQFDQLQFVTFLSFPRGGVMKRWWNAKRVLCERSWQLFT